jgi:hypothetical protein
MDQTWWVATGADLDGAGPLRGLMDQGQRFLCVATLQWCASAELQSAELQSRNEGEYKNTPIGPLTFGCISSSLQVCKSAP